MRRQGPRFFKQRCREPRVHSGGDFGRRPRAPLVHGSVLLRSQAQTKNFFRMSRLAPLEGPLVTRGRGCDPRRFSLHYIASSGGDHGLCWSTGWGCSAPRRRAKRFSHVTASTTGKSTGYPWARMWSSWPLPALYCKFRLRPRVPLVHGLGLFRSQARSKTFFAWHGLHHW